jgi:soluble lytic murein transglycosylase
MRARTRALALVWLFAFSSAALGTGDALSASRHKDIRAHRSKSAAAAAHMRGKTLDAERHTAPSESEKSQQAVTILPPDLDAAKQAIALIRKSKWKDAAALAASVSDPVAKKLIEWALLRSSDSPAGFERYVVFLRANPDWPGALLRRSARQGCGRSGATVPQCVASSAANRSARLAGLRSRVC